MGDAQTWPALLARLIAGTDLDPLFALAAAVSAEELESAPGLAEALAELGIGVVVGVGVGLAGGFRLAVVTPPGMGRG